MSKTITTPLFSTKARLPLLLSIFLLASSLNGAQAKTPRIQKLDFEFSPPPSNSWEAWLSHIHNRDSKDKVNARPDSKSFFSPLPTWVDCHLSWLYEKRSTLKLKIALPETIVLQSNREECSQQSELWAIEKF